MSRKDLKLAEEAMKQGAEPFMHVLVQEKDGSGYQRVTLTLAELATLMPPCKCAPCKCKCEAPPAAAAPPKAEAPPAPKSPAKAEVVPKKMTARKKKPSSK